MSFDYTRARDTASRLIKRFGQKGQIITVTNTGSNFDPKLTATPHDCQIAVMRYKDSDIDGTLIKRSDKMVYVSTEGLDIEVSKSDKIKIEGIDHQIIEAMPLSPAGVVVFWKVQARA